jgi:hypothetical protein
MTDRTLALALMAFAVASGVGHAWMHGTVAMGAAIAAIMTCGIAVLLMLSSFLSNGSSSAAARVSVFCLLSSDCIAPSHAEACQGEA